MAIRLRGLAALLIALTFTGLASTRAADVAVPPVPVPYQILQREPPNGWAGYAYYDWRGQGPTILLGDGWTRRTLEHEKGHLFDWFSGMRDRDRGDFRDIFARLDGMRWRELPSEHFAESYARCGLSVSPGRATAYGYDPSWKQHRRACALIWKVSGLP